MPILILIVIAIIYKAAATKEKHSSPKKPYPPMTASPEERAQWIMDRNSENIQKILRKYR